MRENIARLADRTGLSQWFGVTFLVAFASMFYVNVPFPGSDSGTLAVTLGELGFVLLWLILLALAVSKRYKVGQNARTILLAMVAFLLCYLLVSVVRAFNGDEVKQSLLLLRTTVLPLAIYFAIDAKMETWKRALYGLVVFNLVMNLGHLPDWYDMRMSNYLGNSIVFTGLLVLMIPVNCYALTISAKSWVERVLKFTAAANITTALIFPLWAGSRSMTGLGPLVLLASLILLKQKSLWKAAGISLLIACLAHAFVWFFNPSGAAWGMNRIIPPPSSFNISNENKVLQEFEQENRKVSVEETVKSDSSRRELVGLAFESFKKSPVFGTGEVYFIILNSEGKPQGYAPHNFILEHVAGYGSIGFLFYMALLFAPLKPGLLTWRSRRLGSKENLLALLILGTLMAESLNQPTMLIPITVMVMHAGIGAMKAAQLEVVAGAETSGANQNVSG